MHCMKQAEGCVQGMKQTKGLVYDVWEFGHSVSLEGCFAIQMSDRRGAAERTCKTETDRQAGIKYHTYGHMHSLSVHGGSPCVFGVKLN